jgi:hypothetical protein
MDEDYARCSVNFDFVQCPHCMRMTMPKGNKYCCYSCWKTAMELQAREILK